MNITHKIIILLSSVLLLNTLSYAEQKQAQPKDDRLSESLHLAKPKLPVQQITLNEKNPENHYTLSLSKEELARRPDLIIRGLIPAVMQNNIQAVELLYPLYKNIPQQDEYLNAWSQAILFRNQGEYGKSIEHYRKVFSHNPNWLPLR